MNRNTIQIDTQSLADLGDEAGWPRPSPSHLSSPPFYIPHPLPLSYVFCTLPFPLTLSSFSFPLPFSPARGLGSAVSCPAGRVQDGAPAANEFLTPENMSGENRYSNPTCNISLSRSLFKATFSRWTWVSQYQNVYSLDFIGAKDDGCGGNNWSYKMCKAPVKSPSPMHQHPDFYRWDALPIPKSTVSEN